MLTIDEFFSRAECESNNYKSYAERLRDSHEPGMELIKCGFILWDKREAHIWAGPWCGRGVFFRINDYSYVKWLKTHEELEASRRREVLYGYYTLPPKARDLLSKLRGHNQPDNMTHAEKSLVLSLIDSSDYGKYISNYIKIYNNIVNNFSVTVCQPIRLHLCGNDDTSYSACFANAEHAITALKEVDASPTIDTLKEFDFKFTN